MMLSNFTEALRAQGWTRAIAWRDGAAVITWSHVSTTEIRP
jgi:hypothetical protein